MPQVSRRHLPKSVEEKLFKVFFKSLANISSPTDIQKFLSDLLGPVERTMLAKRLAIAILLAKGYQYETIKDIVKVSQETIARVNIALNYQGEGYKIAIRNALRDEKVQAIFEKIEDATIAMLPNSSVKRVLKNEGLIIVSTPNEKLINKLKGLVDSLGFYKIFFSNIPRRNDDEWHLHSFDLKSFKDCIPAEIKVVSIIPIPSFFLPLRYIITMN